MTVSVVDQFEIIHINHQDSPVGPVLFRFFAQIAVKLPAVVKTGQSVRCDLLVLRFNVEKQDPDGHTRSGNAPVGPDGVREDAGQRKQGGLHQKPVFLPQCAAGGPV